RPAWVVGAMAHRRCRRRDRAGADYGRCRRVGRGGRALVIRAPARRDRGTIEAMASDPASLPSPAPAAPTHPCVRCGKPTAIDRGLCEECNPLGLRDASASQVHGIALLGVIAAIVILAVLARIAVSGIGPFEASVGDV